MGIPQPPWLGGQRPDRPALTSKKSILQRQNSNQPPAPSTSSSTLSWTLSCTLSRTLLPPRTQTPAPSSLNQVFNIYITMHLETRWTDTFRSLFY